MLTISKPLSAGLAQTYHPKEFTAKEQNYWPQQGVIAGEWLGQLATQFGLAGAVSAEDFARLSQGQHPQSGGQLVRQRASYEYQDDEGKTIKTMEHRAGWDATFASTNQMREFFARIGANDRVLLIGDIRVHQGLEPGRPFEQPQEAGMKAAKLDEIVRQQDPALKSAVEMLATGQVPAALDALQQQGRVKEIPNREDRIRTIAKSYLESPENTLIVSPDNASRREMNVAVRQELKANGSLAPEDHTFRVLVKRQDMTGAERTWASHYEIDDVVRYTRGSKAIGIEAAAYASVVAINPSTNQLTVEKANGGLATYDPRRVTGVNVYQEIEREFSAGDRIQFTAPDKSLGVANRDLAVIESIAPDGHDTARVDNNRQIEFNPNEHRHLDHGYAVTSHSSQGLTAERVLVHGDTSVHADLLNSRFAYVSISRASLDSRVYTNDAW
jgi:ATP-dependent exoDNAse (exonuclease V) alpha subunit